VARLHFEDSAYQNRDTETVLDTLLRHQVSVPYSCRNGVCLTCMLRCSEGPVPAAAQKDIRETLRIQGCFLSCLCHPIADMTIGLPDDSLVFGRATVTAVDKLADTICRVRLLPAMPLYYHAGQFVNLHRSDGLVRSYSLASLPRADSDLELHVKRLPGGAMSNWIFESLVPGAALDIDGPHGGCYYLAEESDRPLLLIGNGTGLAPLFGIARDALASDHLEPIHLYHGTRYSDGLYLDRELRAMATAHDNFTYVPCLSGDEVPAGCRRSRAERAAFADHSALADWRVYLCGSPAMVNKTKKLAFLAGAALADICSDPFEMTDKRAVPRD
jgi:NAD(P)H-flavin reductase/ferredoxin